MSIPIRFVVCTYNLWATNRWPERENALTRFLESHEPDILCVQELRAETHSVIDDVLERHQWIDDPFEGWTREGNVYWNRDLFDLVDYGAEDIGMFEEARRLFWARLRPKDGSAALFVSTAHYTWSGNAQEKEGGVNPRYAQAGKTVEVLNALVPAGEPLIFMGDLNDYRHPLRILREGGLTDSFAAGYRLDAPPRSHPPDGHRGGRFLRGRHRPFGSQTCYHDLSHGMNAGDAEGAECSQPSAEADSASETPFSES